MNKEQAIEFAHELADNSENILKKYFRDFGKISTKKDKSLVTQADLEVEESLRNIIIKTFPNHGIIGEEFDNINENAEYKWVIDPIDGTLSFICGRPTFATLIGLSQNNIPILGIINQPINRERWFAYKDQETTFNNNTIKASQCTKIEDAILATSGPYYFSKAERNIFDSIAQNAKDTLFGGDCYLYGLLAMGKIDAIIESGLKIHDYLALIPIIKESGAFISDWQGNDLEQSLTGQVICASTKQLQQQIIKRLNE